MKKPGAGSGGKNGLGSIGKSGLGGMKSGAASSGKSSSVMGSYSKPSHSTPNKSSTSTNKGSVSPISKSSAGTIAKSASPKASKPFDFSSTDKNKSLIPSSPKSYASSSSYNMYGTPKSGKSSTFGIIWIPTGKRNKKKDIVLNYNNDDRRRERSPSFYKLMSGDSHDQPHKKDDSDLLVVPDRKLPGAIAATETALAANIATPNLDEKQHLIKADSEEDKDGAGDSREAENNDDEDKDYLSNDTVRHKLPDTSEVDSVYLRAPPAHKARSTASTPEDDSCGIKCLYYTLQCCDCVLM